MRRRLLPYAVALATLLPAAAGRGAQDIARQPEPPAITSGPPSHAAVQSFDAPVPGARSPRNASYDIDVRLDPATRMLRGREVLHWRNISAHPATELQFHLYWNAWRNSESTWLREERLTDRPGPRRLEDWGWTEVTAIRLRGAGGASVDVTREKRYLAPDDGNPEDRTVMAVPVPTPVAPQASIDVEIEWESKIPFAFASIRTGWIDDYYFVVHWFPKIGVLEDTGWNTHQFHAATEFYADYGVYDVRITVPRGWVLGASGRRSSVTEHADGTATHAYRGEDIHDFAWTTSPTFLDLQRTFEHPRLPRVQMRLLLQPEHAAQADRHFEATAAALRHYGQWFGPYPYDHVTIVDPAYRSGSGGMEYPTLFTAGTRWIAPRDVTQPESVTVHEAGHQFWYGIVGNNEFEHAWLDEGLNTFATARTLEQAYTPNYVSQRYFGGFVPWVFRDVPVARATDGNRLSGYRTVAESDVQATPTFRYWPGTASAITYNKTALWLHTLERHLGWPTLQKAMAMFFDRWKYRHPRPADFFQAVNDASGRDLGWFFDEVYRSSNVFDYGVQEFTSTPLSAAGYFDAAGSPMLTRREADGRYRTVVVAARYGEAVFPVDVMTTFENGERVRERWDGRARRTIYVYERSSRAMSVEVDPERVLLLDVSVTNNSRTIEPKGGRASLKWALAWMVWLQDLMLTYAFFV